MGLNGFDRVAFIYDFLARLVFGKSIIRSQKFFLTKIKNYHKVLILGGGSGWLLAELLAVNPDCQVWYIEASKKMIGLSQKKIKPANSVHFIHGTEADIPLSVKYDAVISNFYLDLFPDEQIRDIASRIFLSLNTDAQWIVTDFVESNKWWQKLLLKLMYYFFRATCHVQAKKLPPWDETILANGMRKIESELFYNGFIEASLYQR